MGSKAYVMLAPSQAEWNASEAQCSDGSKWTLVMGSILAYKSRLSEGGLYQGRKNQTKCTKPHLSLTEAFCLSDSPFSILIPSLR